MKEFLLSFFQKAGGTSYAVNPRVYFRHRLKGVYATPLVDEHLLKQVIHLVLVLRKHVANGVDGTFVCTEQL